jgi:hypothetical protein
MVANYQLADCQRAVTKRPHGATSRTTKRHRRKVVLVDFGTHYRVEWMAYYDASRARNSTSDDVPQRLHPAHVCAMRFFRVDTVGRNARGMCGGRMRRPQRLAKEGREHSFLMDVLLMCVKILACFTNAGVLDFCHIVGMK